MYIQAPPPPLTPDLFMNHHVSNPSVESSLTAEMEPLLFVTKM